MSHHCLLSDLGEALSNDPGSAGLWIGLDVSGGGNCASGLGSKSMTWLQLWKGGAHSIKALREVFSFIRIKCGQIVMDEIEIAKRDLDFL
jgi:hypothetical protein